MLLECRDRRIDLTHRMVVAGLVHDAVDPVDGWAASAVDALVVRTSSMASAVCERVDVPVGVETSPGQVEFAGGLSVSAIGPITDVGADRIGRIIDAITAGVRVLVLGDPATARSDRRVAEVMARLLAARADEAVEAQP